MPMAPNSAMTPFLAILMGMLKEAPHCMLFAVGIAKLGDSQEDLEVKLESLCKALEDSWQKINKAETEYVTFWG